MLRPPNRRWLLAATALALFIALPLSRAQASDVVIVEDESDGVKGLIATFEVRQPREIVFETLNDVAGFKRLFPNVLDVKVVRESEGSKDVFFRVDAVLSEASYTLRRTWKQGKSVDVIRWNRLSGDANVIKGSWQLSDTDKEGVTRVVYRSYVDVSALVPTSTVRSIAMGKIEDMVVRVRKACDERAAKTPAKPALAPTPAPVAAPEPAPAPTPAPPVP